MPYLQVRLRRTLRLRSIDCTSAIAGVLQGAVQGCESLTLGVLPRSGVRAWHKVFERRQGPLRAQDSLSGRHVHRDGDRG